MSCTEPTSDKQETTRPAARILIVEDRALIAAKIERDLRNAGFTIVGMTASVEASLACLEALGGELDGAVLDIDLRGEPVYPVAQRLEAQWVPFLFLTGYGRQAIAREWSNVPRIEKPFDASELVRRLTDLLAGRTALGELTGGGVLAPAVRQAWDNLRQSRDIVTEARAFQEMHAVTRLPKQP